jgi:polysaccharide export outer membrane protein
MPDLWKETGMIPRKAWRSFLILSAGFCALWLSGCQTVRTPEETIADSNIPRELSKTTLPPYVIEPPDILLVEVLEALPGRPIQGERLVRPDGTISLGFYGDVYVAGLTISEAKEKVIAHLRKYLNDEPLGLIQEDEETREFKAVPPAESNRVVVDVAAYNSKFYYVQGDFGAPGRLPITGNETVLDAVQFAGGLMPTAAPQNVRLVRPAPPGACCEQILPVNLAAIINAGDPTTNYQMMPGDRLMVYRDPIVRTTIFLERIAAPFFTVVNGVQSYSFAANSVRYLNYPIGGLYGNTSGSATTSGRPVVPAIPSALPR